MATRRPYDSQLQIEAVVEDVEDLAAASVVYQLYSVLRAALMYAPGHPQTTAAASRFVDANREWYSALGTEELLIVVSGGRIYVNRQSVRAEAADYSRSQWLVQRLAKVGIVEIGLRHDMTPDELAEFARRFAVASNNESRFGEIVDLPGISVLRARTQSEFETLLRQLVRLERYPLLQLYAEGMARVRDVSRSLARGTRPDEIAARRLVAQVIDGMRVDRCGLVGLTTLYPLRDTFGNRRFDTVLLTIALGLELGLTDNEALELGTTTALRPARQPWCPWWSRIAQSVDEAAALTADATGDLERIVTYEGSAPLGRTLPASWYDGVADPHPAARLVAVAEAWVELMQPGAESSPFLADIAMQLLIARAGSDFDPLVIRALLSVLGMYAPGSVVMLNSKDMAVVTEAPPAGADPRRPTVRLLDDDSTGVYALARPELAAYHIVDVLPPHAARSNPSPVFLQ